MRFRTTRIAVVIPVAALLAATGWPPAASAEPAANSSPWQVLASPNPGNPPDELRAVATIAATDVWAVGNFEAPDGAGHVATHSLAEHWDGTSWRVIPTPNVPVAHPSFPGETSGRLLGVTAISARDVWAVGFAFTDNDTDRIDPLIEHWDGTAWSIVPSANPFPSASLAGVTAISATNIWAVGSFQAGGNDSKTLVEHWNGKRWSILRSPSRGVGFGGAKLFGLSAASATDIWAVGNYGVAAGDGVSTTGLIEHWDGLRWKVVPSPALPVRYLWSVAVASATDVWSVGEMEAERRVIEHWDGSHWTVVTAPDTDTLRGVTVINSRDVWAVGVGGSEHWNGSAWELVPVASSAFPAVSYGVASLSNRTLWAVGYHFVDPANTRNTRTIRNLNG